MTQKIVYKVVSCGLDGGLYSLSVHESSDFCIKYEKNKWIKPKIGKIFAFESIDTAIDFVMNVQSDSKIFISNTSKITKPVQNAIPTVHIDKVMYDYWEKGIFSGRCKMSIPKGTVFCDDIILLEEINYD